MLFKTTAVALSVLYLVTGCGGSSSSSPDENQPTPSTDVLTFEGDFQSWADSVVGTINVIDFESVAADPVSMILGNEFEELPGSPVFSSNEEDIFVGNPGIGTAQILTAVSGVNMFFPTCDPACEGVVLVSFTTPITAFGLHFIDVEADFASTGFSLNDTTNPEIPLATASGQNSQTFLGITREQAFSSVYIHFSTGPNIDGSAVDDLSYVLGN